MAGDKPKKVSSPHSLSHPARFVVVMILIVCVLIGGAVGGGVALVQSVLSLKSHVTAAQGYVKTLDLASAHDELESAASSQRFMATLVSPLRWTTSLPIVGRQSTAAFDLIDAGGRTIDAGEKLLNTAIAVAAPLQRGNARSFAELTPQQRIDTLNTIERGIVQAQGVEAELGLTRTLLHDRDNFSIAEPIRAAQRQLYDSIGQIQGGLSQDLPRLEVMMALAGIPREQTYLFLLQNNTEVRATGGFIGTYGVLKTKNGEITSFHTDNVYNLDDPAEKSLAVRPPAPIEKYFKTDKWFFRDSNWSPDFPVSAAQALQFYRQEGGLEQRFDGVIALTQDMIAPLLSVTGPITAEGTTYTEQNFAEQLQYQVEQGFYKRGTPEAQRKEVVGEISRTMMERLTALPLSDWARVGQIVDKAFVEKHALVYFTDTARQQVVKDMNWAGDVRSAASDSLMVVDSNMLAQKTDAVMDKRIAYSVRQDAKGLIGRVELTYTNNGAFTAFTTRYRDWIRVYVPQGSQLITDQGFMVKELSPEMARAQVNTELGKTVFAGYLVVEPKETKRVVLEYHLPELITQQIKQGDYLLLAQKQSGVPVQRFTADLMFSRAIIAATPSIGSTTTYPFDKVGAVHWDADLYTDRDLKVGF